MVHPDDKNSICCNCETGAIPSGGTYAPHQYFPPRMMYSHSYNPQIQFMPGPGHPGYRGVTPMPGQYHNHGQGPPQYRHPPPVQIHNPGREIEVGINFKRLLIQ